jgi:DNA topoisomerase-2
MADQDPDGSHIKGLVINFIHHFWPSLLDVSGFLQQFITPIVNMNLRELLTIMMSLLKCISR